MINDSLITHTILWLGGGGGGGLAGWGRGGGGGGAPRMKVFS